MPRAAHAAVLTAALALAARAASAQPSTAAETERCNRAQDPARFPDVQAQMRATAGRGGGAGAFAQGCLALSAGDDEKASAAFEQAVAADSGRAAYHYFLGRAYGARTQRANIFGRISLARKTKSAFERAVALDPDYVDAREGLMTYYLVVPGIGGGSVDRARAEAEEIRRRNAYRGGLAAVQIAERQKDAGGVLRELDALVRQYPDSAGPYAALTLFYGQEKQWAEAWRAADRLLKTLPNVPVGQYLVGRLAAESGEQLERGAAALGHYLAITPRAGDPPLANAHWQLGAVYERQGRRDAARAEYEAALRLDPKLAGARDALKKLG